MMNFIMSVIASISSASSQSPVIYGDINLVFDGNSLTRSQHENNVEQYMPLLVKSWLEPKCKSLTFTSLGVGGQTMATMLANYDTNIHPLFDANKINILIFGEDVNGVANGGDADTGQGNLDKTNAYLVKANNTGWQRIVNWQAWYKRTPYSVNDDAQARQRRQDYFNLVPNGGLIGNNLTLVDMKEIPELGNVSGLAQDQYCYDHIHLSVLGNQLVAQKFKEVLKTILI